MIDDLINAILFVLLFILMLWLGIELANWVNDLKAIIIMR